MRTQDERMKHLYRYWMDRELMYEIEGQTLKRFGLKESSPAFEAPLPLWLRWVMFALLMLLAGLVSSFPGWLP